MVEYRWVFHHVGFLISLALTPSGRRQQGDTMADQLRVVILKPSKYRVDGYVERFRWGFMPNSTVPYMRSMTPAGLGGTQVEVHTIDEYVHTDLGYLSLLKRPRGGQTLLALVGVQSHQFHRRWTSRRMPGETAAWRSSAAPT